MNPKWLRHQIEELQNHLTHFRKVRRESEASYRGILNLITNPKQRSSLMEKHLFYMDRQDKSIAKVESMHKEALSQLLNSEQSDL